MFYEITGIRQTKRNLKKRWFTCSDMDLYVWLHQEAPVRFRLSYNKGSNEKAICWNHEQGFQHYAINTGESFPDKYKQTPILLDTCDHHELTTIARNFVAASKKLETGLSDFIYARLMEYPEHHSLHSASQTDHSLSE
jgi:hypothetical protein